VRTAAAATLAFVLLTTSGCAFLDDLADPDDRRPAATLAPETGTPSSPPSGEVIVADAQLMARGGGGPTHLRVTVGRVVTGLVLPFSQFAEDCPVDATVLQYMPVEFEFAPPQAESQGLAAHLTVTPGAGTPAGIGDVGTFFPPDTPDERYCTESPPLPTTDTFWSYASGNRITGYIVLDRAVTAGTPEGRPEVFPTLQARISDVRLRGLSGAEEPLTVDALSVGAVCPDDPDALCVSLGGG
jgi:hypothetical protein